jgi:hypothetical protein
MMGEGRKSKPTKYGSDAFHTTPVASLFTLL